MSDQWYQEETNVSSSGIIGNDNPRSNKKRRNRGNGGNGGGYLGNNGGNSGKSGNKKLYYDDEATGKNTGRYINGCDVEQIFAKGVTTKTEIEKLPNIVQKWFTDNPGAKLPQDKNKFKSKKWTRGNHKARAKAFVNAIVSSGVTVVMSLTRTRSLR